MTPIWNAAEGVCRFLRVASGRGQKAPWYATHEELYRVAPMVPLR
jgi:hypothetical protein